MRKGGGNYMDGHLAKVLSETERDEIRRALTLHRGSMKEAAAYLGLEVSSLYKACHRYSINPKAFQRRIAVSGWLMDAAEGNVANGED